MKELIKPFKKDEELLKEIKETQAENRLFIWWLGQSGFLIKYNNDCILIDPYLSDSLTEKYASTDKPHVRISELAIKPDMLDMIKMVTSSHNHTDHLDAETLKPLLKSNADIKFIIPEANRAFVAERCGIDIQTPKGLIDGQTYILNDNISIEALPSAHNGLEVNELGQHKFLGFIIKIGAFTLYHSGDTLWYEGLEKRLSAKKVDIAFLPLNGNKPERKVAGNLSAQEAAKLGKVIGAKCVIPHHYDMFAFNTESPEVFKEHCKAEKTPFKVLEIGQLFEFP